MDDLERYVAEVAAQRSMQTSAAKPKVASKRDTARQFPAAQKLVMERDEHGRFVKGHVPFTGPGRPSLAKALEQVLMEDDERTGKTNTYALAKSIVQVAKRGSVQAFSLIIDRIDGKVTQPIDATVTVKGNDFSDALSEYAAQAADVASAYLAGVSDADCVGEVRADSPSESVHTA